ncbi:MAG: hypothetical protein U0939_07005 [Pirellulales bacterium]
MKWLWTGVMVLASASVADAQGTAEEERAAVKAYAKSLREIEKSIEQREFARALEQLDAAEKASAGASAIGEKGFEIGYFRTQLAQSDKGQAAKDLVRTLPKPGVDFRYAVIHPLDTRVAFVCRDGSLHVFDLRKPDAPAQIAKHPQGVTVWSGAFSLDGKRFFSGHQNGEVLVWDAQKWEIAHTVALGEDWPVRELAVAPDGHSFVAESKKELELWSVADETPKKVAGIAPRLNFGEGLAFSPTGDAIATGGMFDIQLHDPKTGEKRGSFRHASYTMGIEFSPDGKLIASAPRGNVNKLLAVFERDQPKPLFQVGPLGNYVAGMAFSPDGMRIATTGCDKWLRIYHARTGEVLLSLPRVECGGKPMFSRDGRILGWTEPAGFYFVDLDPPQ